MDITREMVNKVAILASLELSEEEATRSQQELGRILTFVEQLDGLDLSSVAGDPRQVDSPVVPRQTISGIEALRPDQPAQTLSREELMANGPAVEDGFFVVPNIL